MKKILICAGVALMFAAIMSGCCLSHAWQEATCIAPKTCASCGATEGEALPHTWIDATCTEAKRCQVCNHEEGKANGHQWKAATCIEPETCEICQATRGEAKGHSVTDWETEVEATCQKEGLAKGTCIFCDTVIEKEIAVLEHTPGEWIVTEKATLTDEGKRERACMMCDKILDTEAFELSDEEYEAAYKAACKTYSYSQIARSPADYKGEMAVFTGEVIQVQQEKAYGFVIYVLRVNVTKQGTYYPYYTDTVYVEYIASEDAPRILEDDIITMYGMLEGEKTYTTVMGASITIPLFDAEYIDIK